MKRIKCVQGEMFFAILFVVLVLGLSAFAELPTEDPPHGPLHPMLKEVIEAGPYQPQWESLVKHPMPDWFVQDKIGLSAHWGPYAVPGWTPRKDSPYGVAYAEWYWEWLKQNEAVKAYHKQHYGEAKYDDFFDGTKNLVTGETDGFFAKDFDADEWMRIFKKAGVKYFFITSKHHDGFCIWDSKYTDRNAMQMGAKRDLYGEMVVAARRHGLRIGFYYSFYEWNNPIYRNKPDLRGYKGIKKLSDEDGDGNSNEYVDDFMIPQIKELIDKYHPDTISFDGDWEHGYPYWRARQIVAYYYNQAAARGQEVVINDRFGFAKEGVSGTRGIYGDFRHVEYHANIDRGKPWAMWRGFGNSYGYNRNEHPDNILSVNDVIRTIVNCVSDNGNIEFNIGPKADGTLAEFELERLAAMGEWLSVNGEAIYGTEKSPVGIIPAGRVTHKPTAKTLYFHVYDWPTDGFVELPGILSEIASAKLLANGKELMVTRPEKDVVRIKVPDKGPDKYVSVIELKYQGELKAEKYILKVKADTKGVFTLGAKDATIQGATLKFEEEHQALGFWSDTGDYPQWTLRVKSSGKYLATVEYACIAADAGGEFELQVDGKAVGKRLIVPNTGGWGNFQIKGVAQIELDSGLHTFEVKALKKKGGSMMNLRQIRLIPSDLVN